MLRLSAGPTCGARPHEHGAAGHSVALMDGTDDGGGRLAIDKENELLRQQKDELASQVAKAEGKTLC